MGSEYVKIQREAIFCMTNLITTSSDARVVLYVVNRNKYSLLGRLSQALMTHKQDESLLFEILQALRVILSLDFKFSLMK